MGRLVAVPATLLLLGGCGTLNPALRYEEAARQLRFSLDRVEPRVELAFPLERSRIRVLVDVGVDNPSAQRIRTRRVAGELRLRARGTDYAIGSVGFPEGVEVAASGRSTLWAEIDLGYADLRSAWEPLSGAILRGEAAEWSLAGDARLEVWGVEFGVPFRTRKESGR
ncbi:hypothetical protein [Geothrix sp. 21YS21S-4]|uniref:hypothetical protein n=1 Tax=Geothrix sp. 21YS21S-4 TaxID=3068889 RepID=UPI0027B8DC55|nr:hypothetical protein [Geothrix sp. 21YS21S-4]